MCAVKFHLFVLIPVLLLLKRRWSTMAGMVMGGAVLLAFGAACAGLDSYREWINMLRNPVVSPSGTMTNIHVLVETYHGGVALEITLVLAVVALFVWMCWSTDEFEFLFGVALIAGLLINVHAYVWDSVFLLLAFVLIKNTKLRLALSVFLTPVAYYLLFGPSTIPYVVALLAVLILAAISLLIGNKPGFERFRTVELPVSKRSLSSRSPVGESP